MSTKTLLTIFKISGITIMLIAFIVVPKTKPWFYEVLLFGAGLLMILVTRFTKIKFSKIKVKL